MNPNLTYKSIIAGHKYNWFHNIKHSLVKNWCLKRSRFVYFIASNFYSGDIRINIAMRCREDCTKDWGHAWVSRNGIPLWEPMRAVMRKSKVMLHDDGKTVYWILKSKNG